MIATPDAEEAADKVPQEAPLQPEPDSAQVTPLFWASLLTVAVKFCGWPVCTIAVVGATLTETGAVTVMVAAAARVVSVTEVAVSVTVAGEGTLAGAV